MELETIEDLEQRLTTISDPDERRRLRGKIRRMRRKRDGISITRVGTRSRSRNPYESEEWEASLARCRAEALELGIPEDTTPGLEGTFTAFPRNVSFEASVEAYVARHEARPACWWPMYFERDGSRYNFVVLLGPHT